MKKCSLLVPLLVILIMGLACTPKAPTTTENQTTPTGTDTTPPVITGNNTFLHPNPVETSMPIYGGTFLQAGNIPRSFDGHQQVAYGPTVILPVFNQLVQFDINYKDTVPETIIGDLAKSWEMSPDGTEITFKLHQGVKWHDGVPFTADDVVYNLDKMTDVNRSAIAANFPAYQSSEKIDDYTVKVHLKYASAGFMIGLAAGESVIEAKHLTGTDDQSAEFMVGTGPFILDEFLPGVHLKYKRNPNYFKKDKYGNQLPYLDGMIYYAFNNATSNDALIGRRLDIKNATTGAATVDTLNALRNGAPEMLYQIRKKDSGTQIFLNLKKPPLDDIRVRRALGLVLNEADLIVGYAGDVSLGLPDTGILPPSFGLPQEEIRKLMGWDKPMEERVAEAQRLLTEAGYYPSGFSINFMAQGTYSVQGGAALVFAESLRRYLNINATISSGLSSPEILTRVQNNDYDAYVVGERLGQDPNALATYFTSNGYANFANYSNPEMDKMFGELDHIIDPTQRREAIWNIERLLLTDLPALPTGCFISNYMPYYPWVKNIRWTDMSYSNTNRLEDVWLDDSLRPK